MTFFFFAAEFIQQEGAGKVTIAFQLGVCLVSRHKVHLLWNSNGQIYTPVILGKKWNGGETAPIYMTLLSMQCAFVRVGPENI